MKKYIKDFLLNCAPVSEKHHPIIAKYIEFIESCMQKEWDHQNVFEEHHIIPKSWNSSLAKDPNNIIRIPVKQHILAHQILFETRNVSMIIAFHNIVNTRSVQDLFSHAWCIEAQEKARIEYIQSKRRPVINLNTGVVYVGVTEAERVYQTTGLSAAIRLQRKYCNCWWMHYYEGIDRFAELQKLEQHAQQQEQIRCNKLKNHGSTLGKQNRPVINLNTGEKFISCHEASKAVGLYKGAVAKAIKLQNKAGGYWWEYETIIRQYDNYQQRIDQLECLAQQRKEERIRKQTETKQARHLNAVMCVETGIVYDHACDISTKLCGNKYRLTDCLAKGCKTFKGYHWKYV